MDLLDNPFAPRPVQPAVAPEADLPNASDIDPGQAWRSSGQSVMTPDSMAVANDLWREQQKDPLDKAIADQNQRKSDLSRSRKGLEIARDQYLDTEGSGLFMKDPLTNKTMKNPDGSFVPQMGAQIDDLRAKSQEKVGWLRGALTPAVAGDATKEASDAQAQLSSLEPAYKLKLEKFQRIHDQIERVRQAELETDSTIGQLSATRYAKKTGVDLSVAPAPGAPAAPGSPGTYDTPLSPDDEQRFQAWKKKFAPNDSGADYDLRGAFAQGLTPGPDGHWPDTFKKPNHPTFSDQSIYAKDRPDLAGTWNGDTFVPPSGGTTPPNSPDAGGLPPPPASLLNGDRPENVFSGKADATDAKVATDPTSSALGDAWERLKRDMSALGGESLQGVAHAVDIGAKYLRYKYARATSQSDPKALGLPEVDANGQLQPGKPQAETDAQTRERLRGYDTWLQGQKDDGKLDPDFFDKMERAGQFMEDAAKDQTKVDPKLDKTKLAQVVDKAVAPIATTIALGPLGIPQFMAQAAEGARRDAEEKGATEDQQSQAFLANGTVAGLVGKVMGVAGGAAEIVRGTSPLLDNVIKSTVTKLSPALTSFMKTAGSNAFGRIVSEIVKGSTRGAVEMGGLTAAQNVIAKDVVGYDPTRSRTEGVGESALWGGLGAGAVAGATRALVERGRGVVMDAIRADPEFEDFKGSDQELVAAFKAKVEAQRATAAANQAAKGKGIPVNPSGEFDSYAPGSEQSRSGQLQIGDSKATDQKARAGAEPIDAEVSDVTPVDDELRADLAKLTDASREPAKDVEEKGKPVAPTETPTPAKAAYDKSSTQVTLPEAEAKPIRDAIATIPDSDIYTEQKGEKTSFGRENEPHITALYGINNDDVAPVKAALAKVAPITVKLGKVSSFENADKPYDVLKVDVDSPEMHAVNAAIKAATDNSSDFPDYKPHMTLAYVKKGTAAKYTGSNMFEGKELTFNSLQFRTRDGRSIDIPLTGEKGAVAPGAPPVAKSATTSPGASAPRRGVIGDALSAGEVVSTASGRQTTPFPKFDISTDRKAQNSARAADGWLHENAVAEAQARGDDFNLTQFQSENPKNLPQASKDAMEHYLFGEKQPAVLKPLLKPLSPQPDAAKTGPSSLFTKPKSEGEKAGAEKSPEKTALKPLPKDISFRSEQTYLKDGERKTLRQYQVDRTPENPRGRTVTDDELKAEGYDTSGLEAVRRASAPVAARGSSPLQKVKAIMKQSGLKVTDREAKFLQDFLPRLNKANPVAFKEMEIRSLSEAQWADLTLKHPKLEDSAAAFDAEENTMYLRRERTQGKDIVPAFVHEAGHFAEQYALGEKFAQEQWESLSDEQRSEAWKEYSGKDVPGDALKTHRTARKEWAAMQFGRVVTGETEGMNPTMRAKLADFLKAVREMVQKWVGNIKLTTAELDAKILEMLGYNKPERASEGSKSPQTGENAPSGSSTDFSKGPSETIETPEKIEGKAKAPDEGHAPSLPPVAPPKAEPKKPTATFKEPSKELRDLADDLFGTPAEKPDEYNRYFHPDKLEAANKFLATLVREYPEVRSRAALAQLISEQFPKARVFSNAVFKGLGMFKEMDENGTFADAYAKIDAPAKIGETAPDERTGTERSSQPSGERRAGETEPSAGTVTGNDRERAPQQLASAGLESGEGGPGRTESELPARKPGGSGRSDERREPAGPSGDQVEVTGSKSAEPTTGVSETTGAGKRSGEGSGANAPTERPRSVAKPEKTEADRNHRIEESDTLIPGGDKAKARGNLAALKLLRTLESENRNPTPEEKKVLAQYVGWGGLPNVFNDALARQRDTVKRGGYMSDEQKTQFDSWQKNWGSLYDELKSSLTPSEWSAAARSTLNAHYTSREVIGSMWDLARHLGFDGGKALETSAGIGHFLGLEPKDMAEKTKWGAVELDDVSGRMLKKLYPEANVQNTGFQDAKIANHSMDLVIGNVPFAKDGPRDSRYPRLSLHNYFFARGLDTLKPGGVMIAITSDSTMDSPSSKSAREWLAERADLIGAIRLPNNAFKKNAGTEVTTDILILKKRGGGTSSEGQNWLNVQKIPTYDGKGEVPVNEYFARHPEMMLGRMSLEGSMYRENEPALLPNVNQNLPEELASAIKKLPANILSSSPAKAEPAATPGAVGEASNAKDGAIVVKDKHVYESADGTLQKPDWASSKPKVELAKSYVGLRDDLKSLIDLMRTEGTSDSAVDVARQKLNQIYDAHVEKFGHVNERGHNFLEDDPELALVQSLEDIKSVPVETVIKAGKNIGQKRQSFEKQYIKAAIFTKRTIVPRIEPTSADTVGDAISQSLAYRNGIDPAYIASLRSISEDQAREQLKAEPDVFQNPKSGGLESRDDYLGGFVREKLDQAKEALKTDPAYQKNVDALEKVQPAWLGVDQISMRLGSSWLPPHVIEKFLKDKLGVSATVTFVEQTGHWKLAPHSGVQEALNVTTLGTERLRGHELVEDALNLKTPVVYDTVETPTGTSQQKNQADTLIAQQKQSEIQALFKEYAKSSEKLHPELEKIYNDNFNGVRLREFTGPTWDYYPNASSEIKLRQHQKDVVTRILQESTLLAHSVGTGKTFIMATAAMEMRRLGMAKKPMIVTQNATTQQFAASFKKLYPTARILVPAKKQRKAENRKRLVSQIATGDYDSVIIPQSFLNQIPDDPQRMRSFVEQEIGELSEALASAKQSEGAKAPRVKDLEKAKTRLEERLKDLADRKVDNTVLFEQLGVDALFVDEAHAYKKLEFTSQMDNIKGLDRGASERGLGLYMKTRFIQEKNNGKNVVLATGTPVSNTIAEAWNMMRFTRPDLLKKYHVERFDDFASTFGDTVTNLEQTAGGTFKTVTRFAKFANGPELIALFHSGADVVLKEDINLPGLPALKNGQPTTVKVPQTEQVKAYIGILRAELMRFEQMSGQEKRENSHIPLVTFTLAKKSTLDLRLIDPRMPDEPGTKLHQAVDQIAKKYQETRDVKGAQLVFADLFRSPDGTFNLYHTIKEELISKGVPGDQIAIITDAKNDAQRERIFEMVKAGDIAVMLGSTEKMGVGVNVQDRLIALHHLDAPARPMDIEQRNGRIVRQGNTNGEVEIFNYGVENTLDATLYQRLAIKQKFINQIMRGDVEGRSFEDAADEVSMTFEEQMAAFSGNPLAMKKVALEGETRRLESLKQGHIRQLAATRNRLAERKESIERMEAYQPKVEAVAKKLGEAIAGEATGEVEGKTYNDRKSLVQGLDTALKEFAEQKRAEIGTKLQGRDWLEPFGSLKLWDVPINLTLHIPTNQHGMIMTAEEANNYYTYDALVDGIRMDGQASTGQGLLTSFSGQVRSLASRAENNKAETERYGRDVTEMEGFLKQPFQQETELAKARADSAAIEKELAASSAAEAAKPAEQATGAQADAMRRSLETASSQGTEPKSSIASTGGGMPLASYRIKSSVIKKREHGGREGMLGVTRPEGRFWTDGRMMLKGEPGQLEKYTGPIVHEVPNANTDNLFKGAASSIVGEPLRELGVEKDAVNGKTDLLWLGDGTAISATYAKLVKTAYPDAGFWKSGPDLDKYIVARTGNHEVLGVVMGIRMANMDKRPAWADPSLKQPTATEPPEPASESDGEVLGTPAEPPEDLSDLDPETGEPRVRPKANKPRPVPGAPGDFFRSLPDTENEGGANVAEQRYTRRAQKPDLETAQGIIDERGPEEAMRLSMDTADNGTPMPVKQAIYVKLIEAANKRLADAVDPQELAAAIRARQALSTAKAPQATELGQGISMFQQINKTARGGAIEEYLKNNEAQRDQQLGPDAEQTTQEAADAIIKANKDAIDQATKELQKVLRKKSLTKSLWQNYRDYAAKQLEKFLSERTEGKPEKAPLFDFTNRIVAEMRSRLADEVNVGVEKAQAPSAAELLGEAIKNKEKYGEVFETVREQLAEKYADQPEMMDKIDLALANIGAKPYSKRLLDRAVKEAHNYMALRITDVAKMHFTKADRLNRDLATAFTMEAGLTGASAKSLAEDLEKRMQELTADAKTKAIDTLIRQADTPRARKILSTIQKAVLLNNYGALSRGDVAEMVAKQLKLPHVNPDTLKKISDVADRIETAKNESERARAELDMLQLLHIARGITKMDVGTSVFYANMLSGYSTHLANTVGNITNGTLQLATMMAVNPKHGAEALRGWINGFGEGWTSGKSIMKTGRGGQDLDAHSGSAGNTLELVNYERDFPKLPKVLAKALQKHAEALRYVTRAMKAMDAVFYYPAREARARVLVAKLLEGQYQGKELYQKTRELLGIAPDQLVFASEQAKREGYTGLDASLRTHAIIEEKRRQAAPKEAEASHQFALHTTYNNDPEGWAGILYQHLVPLTQKFTPGGVPVMKAFLPFLRIPTNIFNVSLNYTPMGSVRALRGMPLKVEEGADGKKHVTRREFTGDERSMLHLQSIGGSLLLAGLTALALNLGSDDDEHSFDLTATGPDDFKKRQQLEGLGWRPYSLKIGKTWISYKDSPFLLPLAIAGHVVDAVRFKKQKEDMALGSKVLSAVLTAPRVIFDTSMLSGLSSMMNFASGKSSSKQVEEFLARTAGTVAFPNLLNQIDRAFNPETREANGPLGVAGSVIPFVRNTGDVKTDVLGQPIEKGPVSRFASVESDDPVRQVLRAKNVYISTPDRDTKFIGKTPMDEDQYREFVRLSGERIYARLKPYVSVLKRLPPDRVEQSVRRIEEEERKIAKGIIISHSSVRSLPRTR